jgi:L,D-peptidoglycan transpeptidase YkuD (ErfK/YbiS/YcfS/YnhG family)
MPRPSHTARFFAFGLLATAGGLPGDIAARPLPASGASGSSGSSVDAKPLRTAETALLSQARQLVVVSTPDWDAAQGTLQLWVRANPTAAAGWQRTELSARAWIGRAGSAWRSDRVGEEAARLAGPRKREGDGRSPAGLFVLGGLWGYAAQAPRAVRLPYRTSDERDRCIDDSGSPDYNQLRRAPAPGPLASSSEPWQSAEHLRLPTDHYKLLVPIDYNGLLGSGRKDPPRRGAGSCIFLHVAPPPGGGTAGCTALLEADLLRLLRALDPSSPILFLLLPVPAQAQAQRHWGIPGELFALPPGPPAR